MTLAKQDTQIESKRLSLRRMTSADLPFYTRIHSDPDVARYIGLGRPRTVEETRLWLEKILYTYDAMELGQLAVVRKADGALIGRSGISFLAIDPAPLDGGAPLGYFVPGEAPTGIATRVEGELGYTFDRSAWGQGFAREAAGAVFDYARRTGKQQRIVSLIDPDNARSHRVASSLGAVRVDGVRAFGRMLDRYAWPG
jgi:[ribosomal protein S5]-alanine N-acetyltransferase